MAGGNVPVTFRVFRGDEFLREETYTQPTIKIGKLASSHLRLDDVSISRMHAVVEIAPSGEVSIIDLGSTKGTFVNGEKVTKAKLISGDKISLGALRIVVEIGVAVEAAPEPSQTPASAPMAQAAMQPQAGAAGSPIGTPPSGYSTPIASVDDGHGERAIEVAAMLGSSVMNVKHVMNPRGGKVSVLTLSLFAIGAVSLALASFSFLAAVGNAGENTAKQHEWVTEKRRPEWRFEPQKAGTFYDWSATGGLGLSLFVLCWGVARIRKERRSPYYKVGGGKGVDFATNEISASAYPFVAPIGDDFVLNCSSEMDGEMILDGKITPLGEVQSAPGPDGGLAYAIPRRSRFRIRMGANTLMVSSVPKPKTQSVAIFSSIESHMLAYLFASAVFFVSIILFLDSRYEDPNHWMLSYAGDESGLNTNYEDDAKEDEQLEEDEEDDEEEGGTGERQAGEEGKMGKEEEKKQDRSFRIKNRNDKPQIGNQQAKEMAATAGMLAMMSSAPGSAMSSPFGVAGETSGMDAEDFYGGMNDGEAGDQYGHGGWGQGGFGAGGGGSGYGTVGAGAFGTIGMGSGTGTGVGVGSGSGSGRGRRGRVPRLKIARGLVQGDLDKAIIRRYIRRQKARIQNCYNKELLIDQDLRGTVTVNFTIMPAGHVIGSIGKGSKASLNRCVSGVIGSIQFPEPRGGGIVKVRYPFHFDSR